MNIALPRYTPYASGQHKLSVGLQPADPHHWFEPDHQWAEQMANKAVLLRFRHDAVVAALPGSEPAQEELLGRMWDHLPLAFPGRYQLEPEGMRLRDLHPGGINDNALSAIDRAGRLVQEDVCLLEVRNGAYVLTAATLAAPSGWHLHEKLGQPLLGIHAPVPGYEAELGHRVQRIFEGLRSDQVLWRANFVIVTEPTLFMPGGHAAAKERGDGITPDNADSRLWLRVERQTLTRLEKTGAVVFTIKTLIDPLASLTGQRALCQGLKGALETMAPGMQAYKSFSGYKTALFAWLDQQQ